MTTFHRTTPDTADHTGRTWRGAATVAAVTGPLLLVVSFGQPPDGPSLLTATKDQIQAYAQSQAGAVHVGALAGTVSVALLLAFTAALTTIMRTASPRSMLADLFAGSSYLLIASLFLGAVAGAVPTVLPDLAGPGEPSAEMLSAWWGVAGVVHGAGDFQMVFITVLIGAFSLSGWRTRVVPRWVSGVGAAVTVAAALGTAGVTLNSPALYGFWFGGMFGWVLWLPLVGIALRVRSRAGRRPRPDHAPAPTGSAPAESAPAA
jgi:hypothetical protein